MFPKMETQEVYMKQFVHEDFVGGCQGVLEIDFEEDRLSY